MSAFITLTILRYNEAALSIMKSTFHIEASAIFTLERTTLKGADNQTVACTQVQAAKQGALIGLMTQETPDVIQSKIEAARESISSRPTMIVAIPEQTEKPHGAT